mmetsp:Transcript_11696/g.31492  ORF Transcript_11696/g.31492 Transcript_11696/m.31492 type:complete len:220 (+) Transcript_11696:225-884(+)
MLRSLPSYPIHKKKGLGISFVLFVPLLLFASCTSYSHGSIHSSQTEITFSAKSVGASKRGTFRSSTQVHEGKRSHLVHQHLSLAVPHGTVVETTSDLGFPVAKRTTPSCKHKQYMLRSLSSLSHVFGTDPSSQRQKTGLPRVAVGFKENTGVWKGTETGLSGEKQPEGCVEEPRPFGHPFQISTTPTKRIRHGKSGCQSFFAPPHEILRKQSCPCALSL